MPYINATTTIKISDEKKEIIKSELGQVITEIPGKSEEWLMVGFKEENTLYFKGNKKERAAFIQIKIFGTTERKYKEALTFKVSNLFERELEIPMENIYLTIDEISDWGWNGSMF